MAGLAYQCTPSTRLGATRRGNQFRTLTPNSSGYGAGRWLTKLFASSFSASAIDSDTLKPTPRPPRNAELLPIKMKFESASSLVLNGTTETQPIKLVKTKRLVIFHDVQAKPKNSIRCSKRLLQSHTTFHKHNQRILTQGLQQHLCYLSLQFPSY